MNKTIDYYNKNAKDFVSGTLECKFDILQDKFLNYLQKNAKILDLGCGSGRDSKYFKDKGFIVTAIDGSKELCKFAQEQIKQDVICCDFNDINFNNEFDGIWACASLLHLKKNMLPNVIKKCLNALKPNGIFYLSFKYGNFEGYRNERYFTDLNEVSFNEIIKNFQCIKIKELFISNDVRQDRQDERWLNVFISK